MKKIIVLLLTLTLVLSVGVLFASAEDGGTNVYVTIADKDGKLALAYESVNVTDIDSDGVLTVNDVLYAAHEQFYEGGAAAGYATATTKWGLSLMKLWGVANGGSYGYTVNDAFAWSMTDPVQENDYVAAYVYIDTKLFSDKYSYFDQKKVELTDTADLTLPLSIADFDSDGNSITLPVAGAELTIDGEPTGVLTDAEGKATINFKKNGKFLVSATSTDLLLVPPVCIVTVSCFEESTPDEAATEAPTVIADVSEETEPVKETVAPTTAPATKDQATKDQATKDSSSSGTPKTGDATMLWLWILIAAVCLCGIIIAIVIYKKKYANK